MPGEPVERPIRRLLVANRGEIALRIQRACRELGIETVQVYSSADRDSRSARESDHAVWIGAGPARESYLCGERLVRAARALKADAIHPGYGFLSENAAFAAACGEAGITFVGPPPLRVPQRQAQQRQEPERRRRARRRERP